MSRLAFRDFDEFADSIRGVAGRFVPTKPSASEWWVEALPAGRLSLQRLQIGGAATFAGDGEVGCFTIGIPMSDPRIIHIDGELLDARSFLFLKEKQPFTFASEAESRWSGITIPIEHSLIAPELVEAAQAHGTARGRSHIPQVMRLREIAVRVCAADGHICVDHPIAAHAVEQEILTCVSHALEHSTHVRDLNLSRFHYSRSAVIKRTLELMEASAGQALHIADLCAATGVSERTLRNIFNEYFGVGPMRLLKLRQLREIRVALAAADARYATVAGIAAQFGIWDFSLFARNYKRLFGESPSQTLRMPPGRLGSKDNLSWMDCMTRIFIEDIRPAAVSPQSRAPSAARARPQPGL